MDTVTQALCGAAAARLARPATGRAGLWTGAAAGVLPDLDMLSSLWGPWVGFQVHRGPTHSLLFVAAGALAGATLWRRWLPSHDFRTWLAVWGAALLSHPLLDLFTAYGTQLLWPLTDTRFALDGVGLVDPVVTAALALALGGGRRRAWAGVGAAALYLLLGTATSRFVAAAVRSEALARGEEVLRVRALPTWLQPVWKRVLLQLPGRWRVGYVSVLHPREGRWAEWVPAASPAVQELRATREGRLFAWFADGWIAGGFERDGASPTVFLEDLRYGWPGDLPRGLWGIRAQWHGGRLGVVERYRRATGAGRGRQRQSPEGLR